MAKQVKNWENTFVLRQEYNQYQKCWFPIIFYWNCSQGCHKKWIECLCTETGSSHTYNDASFDYYRQTKAGTSKCDPEHVKYLLDQYRADWQHDIYDPNDPEAFDGNQWPVEVKKLTPYMPKSGIDY